MQRLRHAGGRGESKEEVGPFQGLAVSDRARCPQPKHPRQHHACTPGMARASSAMGRVLRQYLVMEWERVQREEEEVDKVMQEEQDRRKKKEMEERMSLEETEEQILTLQEKLLAP
ncbi:hypothetical protein HPG69_019524 [Diceros bicornis minor]|uniref:Uncharacterized protein n=1 Tax=Diceros bicornis minor TaxID=77932 RepID=A0A7J7E640_DICBM|nr:hypothetical protein HPG69_019524 [Diceros bicornis minor]